MQRDQCFDLNQTALATGGDGQDLREATRAYIRDNQAKWRNPKHVAQYYMTLLGEAENGARAENDYCAPIHDVPVGEVDTAMVLSVLRPIWYASFSEGR